MNFYKVGMSLMNLMCIVLSIATILAGYAIMQRLEEVKTIIGVPLQFLGFVLYTMGLAILVLVVTVGCVGAMRENGTLLFMYSFFMLFLTIFQIFLICFAVLQISDVSANVNEKLKMQFKGVLANNTESINYYRDFQTILHCCGFSRYSDYNGTYPDSCCEGTSGCNPFTVYKIGCVTAIKEYLHGITELFSGICIVSGMLQFFIIIYVGFFADKIKLGEIYF